MLHASAYLKTVLALEYGLSILGHLLLLFPFHLVIKNMYINLSRIFFLNIFSLIITSQPLELKSDYPLESPEKYYKNMGVFTLPQTCSFRTYNL